MRELAVVVDQHHHPIYWHTPWGATAVSVPDSRVLWEAMWDRRHDIAGVAHLHPGVGVPRPSLEDVTTFAACEAGLGRRLVWWIATADDVRGFSWAGPDPTIDRLVYRSRHVPADEARAWLAELRVRGWEA